MAGFTIIRGAANSRADGATPVMAGCCCNRSRRACIEGWRGLHEAPLFILHYLSCTSWESQNGPHRLTGGVHGADLVPVHDDALPTEYLALTLGPTQSGNNTIGQPRMLLLGNRGQYCDDSILNMPVESRYCSVKLFQATP